MAVSLPISSLQAVLQARDEFLARGADLDSACKSGNTALHCSTSAGYPHVVKRLLAPGANVKALVEDGKTALDKNAFRTHLVHFWVT